MILNRFRFRAVSHAIGLLIWAGTAHAASTAGEANDVPFSDEELVETVRHLADDYFSAFQHPDTHILYGARLSGKEKWTSPEDINREMPQPWGYGSRIADTVLHTGHMLVALLDAWESRPDPWLRAQIAKHFAALKLIGSLPETHPKPGKTALRGLVPRGPHPDALSAYYDDSSMDQHTTYIISLARYANSPLASEADRDWIRESLGKVGRRLEEHDWSIVRADGVTEAHVGFSWKGFNSNHASILLPAVLALYRGTGDAHWKDVYEGFIREKEGLRWEMMRPGPHVSINGHPIYANQNAFRLNAYQRFEEDPERKRVIRALLDQSVSLQMERDFPGEMYRKFHSEDTWARLRRACLWEDENLHGCAEAWERFAPSMLAGEGAGLAALAHVRFPLGGYHMALLSENPDAIRGALLPVWEMLSTVDLNAIDAGETHYLFTVVALHLYAQHFAATDADPDQSAGEAVEGRFGEELSIARDAGIGSVMDVAVDGDLGYAIGSGFLYVLDISKRSHPRVVGTLKGLGRVRQVVARDKTVYVTSREDGLFIIDVADPAVPKLLNHYDTIEFATGVAISGDVLFVACRTFGVELIDVSDPRAPAHLSTIRTGEAQSVVARNGYLYAGVWASSEVVVADVRDPRAPVITARVPLDGFGDGVDVRGGYLYVATGHHSRERPNREPGDPGFGRGHGLEIFRIDDAAKPEFLSRVKFPPLYHMGHDMWGVSVVNGRAFVADTHNGMFVVDVREPDTPKIAGRCELPFVEERGMRGFAGGLAVTDDHVYVAGGETDLHVLDLPGVASEAVPETDAAPLIGPCTDPREAPWRSYRPEGQVHAVEFLDDGRAVAACGSAGVHVIEVFPEVRVLSVLDTEGFATDVAEEGRRVFVAESAGGLSVCEISGKGDRLVRLGRYCEGNDSIRQVEALDGKDRVLVTEGSTRIKILDVTNPADPEVILTDVQPGLLYGDQLMRGLAGGRYAAAFWHVSGVHWYDMNAAPAPVHAGNWPQRIGSLNGLIAMGDRTLATVRGGYVLVKRDERRPLDDVPVFTVGDEREHLGRPALHGDRLYCSARTTGLITIADISNPEHPVLVEQFVTPGNPGRIAVSEKLVAIPDGYGGLLVIDRES